MAADFWLLHSAILLNCTESKSIKRFFKKEFLAFTILATTIIRTACYCVLINFANFLPTRLLYPASEEKERKKTRNVIINPDIKVGIHIIPLSHWLVGSVSTV